MRVLALLATVFATTTPSLPQIALRPAQVGKGYVLLHRQDGSLVKGAVTLDLCGTAGYPSELLRTSRLQVDYLKQGGTLGLSNEVVTYKAGGAAQALREVLHHALTCPKTPVSPGEQNLPPLHFTITRIIVPNLLSGYVAVRVRVQGTVKGKKIDSTSYAIYQRLGNTLSGVYSFGANTPAQLAFAEHAAAASAKNLEAGSSAGKPTA